MSLTERAGPAPDLVAMSKAMMGEGSKSFAQAAALFDRETRAGAYLLYAWCRHCDDVIDGQELGHGREELTPESSAAGWTALRPDAARRWPANRRTTPVFAAFQAVALRYAIRRSRRWR
jgi:phytoene synthase